MASSSSQTTIPIQGLAPIIAIKLSSTNFIYWRTQMLPLLSYQQLLHHIDGSETAPAPVIQSNDKEVDNLNYLKWVQEEQQAIIILNASLTEEALSVTVSLSNACDIWIALESAFCNTYVERVRDNLRALKKEDKSVAEYGRAFKAICDQLHAIGHPVDVMDQLHWFLCGLGTAFESFSTTVRSARPIPSFVNLLARRHKLRDNETSGFGHGFSLEDEIMVFVKEGMCMEVKFYDECGGENLKDQLFGHDKMGLQICQMTMTSQTLQLFFLS